MTGWFRLRTILLVTCASAVPLGTAVGQSVIDLDVITVLATKLKERAIEALAGVSVVTEEKLERTQPTRIEDAFAGVPGLMVNANADDLGVGFNVRGLQDYGRVAVVVDGARQNFQVAQHGPEGKVYLDPELMSEAEVARGPVTNVYGSGAIGGVVSISTKTADDILAPDERFGAQFHGMAGTNQGPFLGSLFIAGRPTEDFDLLLGATARRLNDYKDGNGDTVENTWSDTYSLLFKSRIRPQDGHELTFGVSHQHALFDSGDPGDPADTSDGGTDYGNVVDNTSLTGKYTVSGLDPLVDFAISGFWNHGSQETVVKEQYCTWFGPPIGPCYADFTGPVGTTTNYNLDTFGFDTHNSSRFDAAGLQHTVTFGADLFHDSVVSGGSSSAPDAGYRLTASGNRLAYGGFAEWKAGYGTLIDVIGALRYDGFAMNGAGNNTNGQRVSPKVTVGITPIDWFTVYGTYAEGYRAPSVNEAFATGQHPGGIFQFLPNTGLGAETGHTWEAGINVKFDALFTESDALRFKASVFRNEVTNYIGLEAVTDASVCSFASPFGPGVLCYQYQNIDEALIQGVELEGSYDAGRWFVQASGTFLDGKNADTKEHLASVLPGQAMVTVGARFFDDKLTIAPNWKFGSGGSYKTSEGQTVSFQSYNLYGLSVSYEPSERTVASLVLENIGDVFYTPYLQNKASPGFTAKGSIKVKLAR